MRFRVAFLICITKTKKPPEGGFKVSKKIGGDERIRTSDQSFSPDAPLAGECLRPARPRLRINAITTPDSLTDSAGYPALMLIYCCWSSSKALCKARTANSIYFSSITTEILISLVEIIKILMPSSDKVRNILLAMPT